MDGNNSNDDLPDIPDFLKRGPDGKAPFMLKGETQMSVATQTEDAPKRGRPAKTAKADVGKPAKADKPVKAAKGSNKPAKAAKASADVGKAIKPAKAAKAADKGNKPAKARSEPAGKDAFGLRVGSIKSKAASMYAGKKGATLQEVKDEVGSIQLNLLKDLEAKGFTVKKVKEDGEGKRQVTRYFLSAPK